MSSRPRSRTECCRAEHDEAQRPGRVHVGRDRERHRRALLPTSLRTTRRAAAGEGPLLGTRCRSQGCTPASPALPHTRPSRAGCPCPTCTHLPWRPPAGPRPHACRSLARAAICPWCLQSRPPPVLSSDVPRGPLPQTPPTLVHARWTCRPPPGHRYPGWSCGRALLTPGAEDHTAQEPGALALIWGGQAAGLRPSHPKAGARAQCLPGDQLQTWPSQGVRVWVTLSTRG